jgi:two-component system sensor histidine kinase MprB
VTLRARLGLAAGVAVALAVVAVAVSAYAGTRSDLRGQIDNSLTNIARSYMAQPGQGGAGGLIPQGGAGRGAAPRSGGAPPAGAGGFPAGLAGPSPTNCDHGIGINGPPNQAFGGAPGYVQLATPNGRICPGTDEKLKIPVDSQVESLARSGHGRYFTDMHVDGYHLRVLVTGIPSAGALMIALPLTGVDHTLHNQLLLFIGIAAGGIALAGLLGLLVAQTALSPIVRFTRRTEAIASAPERLDQRVEVSGRDELSRLARSFNGTLETLERSVQAQRNLVADASHELRTPIATLRANLQLLRDEHRLTQSDREALREDMIEELDELTGLVGDVVELARGTKLEGSPGDVRLDQIVSAELERIRRRGPELKLSATVEPTLVHGEPDRIARAVTNVLDNARKWSPADGAIEVELADGVLSVRDHGPGFHPQDLPFVFDRFHRASDARSKPGSGLGLAIVRQAAEAHGGSAEAANAPDGGAVVRVGFGPVLAANDELSVDGFVSASVSPPPSETAD